MILEILKSTWSLFLGMAFLMLGNGLSGTLISWRANYEGFPSSTTGLIMTAYYVGFLSGSLLTVKLIKKVGHVRVFAALASLASSAVLIQIIFITPWAWGLMRLLTGFCFAGTYVIVEGWLNERSDNNSRGQILSLYMLVSYAGLAGGQGLFNSADPTGFSLFLMASILLSVALVPVLITRTDAPELVENESMSPKKLFKIAPAGVVTIILSAIVQGSIFGMAAVFAANAGMSVSQTAVFMSVFITCGALSHWPLGWLSDHIDRRLVIVASSLFGALLSAVLMRLDTSSTLFIIVFGLFCALVFPLYSLGVTQTNDRLWPEQMTSASSTIVLMYGLGAALGPITVGYVINLFGNSAYLTYLGLVNLLTAVLVSFYIFQREAVPDEEQGDFQVIPSVPTAVTMDAVAQEAEETMGLDEEEEGETQ